MVVKWDGFFLWAFSSPSGFGILPQKPLSPSYVQLHILFPKKRRCSSIGAQEIPFKRIRRDTVILYSKVLFLHHRHQTN